MTTLQTSFGTTLKKSFSDLQDGTERLDSFSGDSSQDGLTDWSNGLELTANDF
jgi:hypothetical protein